MPYDEQLAARVRDLVGPAEEKSMFGGRAFLVGGRMVVCVSAQGGILLGAADAAQATAWAGLDHVGPMRMGARTSDTWVHVDAPALADDDALLQWVERGRAAAGQR